MRKIIGFNKPEKVVIIVGIGVVAIVLVLGLLKNNFSSGEAYIPVTTQTTNHNENNAVELKLKQGVFPFKVGSEVTQDALVYFDNTKEELKDVQLDFSGVNAKVVGTYDVFATLDEKRIDFKISIVNDLNPTFKVAHPSFIFYIEKDSKIDEVIEYAGVVATDAAGKDISLNVEGWPTELPTTAQVQRYTIKAVDSDGNTANTTVVVQYRLRTE